MPQEGVRPGHTQASGSVLLDRRLGRADQLVLAHGAPHGVGRWAEGRPPPQLMQALTGPVLQQLDVRQGGGEAHMHTGRWGVRNSSRLRHLHLEGVGGPQGRVLGM